MFGGQRGSEFDDVPMLRWNRDNDVFGVRRALFAGDRYAVVVVIDAPDRGFQYDAVAEFARRRAGDLLRAGRETVLLGTVFDVEHSVQTTGRAGVTSGVQHRHVIEFASPGDPRHDGQQIPAGGAGAHRSQPLT